MRSWVLAFGIATSLAACGGNPFTATGGGGTPTTTVIDKKIARDMVSADYNGTELRINMTGLISSAATTLFVRAPTLDIASAGAGQPAYLAFKYQETGLQRSYLAFVATNQRGNLIAVSAADGGQFNEHNSGGYFYRTGEYTRPVPVQGVETGQFSYIGTYAGIFVPGPDIDIVRPSGLRPGAPLRVTGTAQINVRFENSATRSGLIEGGVVNRVLRDDTGAQVTSLVLPTTTIDMTDPTNLPDLVLRENVVDSNGRFLGDVEFLGSPNTAVGNYGGLFGGTNASDVAGVLWLKPIPSQNGIWEYGTFNLPRCDLAGASPLCVPR